MFVKLYDGLILAAFWGGRAVAYNTCSDPGRIGPEWGDPERDDPVPRRHQKGAGL